MRCIPKRYYWFLGILVYPLGAFMLTAFLLPAAEYLGIHMVGARVIYTWIILSVLLSAIMYRRDYRRLYYTLLADSLILGRGESAITIPFADIESIVLGLPERMPWWFRMQRYNPEGRTAYLAAVASRKVTAVVRLSGSRYLPFNLSYGVLENGPPLMAEFLCRNQNKVCGPDSYTARETAALSHPRINRIKTIPAAAS